MDMPVWPIFPKKAFSRMFGRKRNAFGSNQKSKRISKISTFERGTPRCYPVIIRQRNMFSGRCNTWLRERYLNFFFRDGRMRAAGVESEGQRYVRR